MEQHDIDLVNQPIPRMDMLDAIMVKIKEQPEQWDQSYWVGEVRDEQGEVCGTSHCVAGWACAMNKAYQIDYKTEALRIPATDPLSYAQVYPNVDFDPHAEKYPGMSRASFSDVAERDLGLTSYEADVLFDGDNDLDDLIIRVEEIRARAKRQQEAFDRLAAEMIASVPELAEVLRPGYLCPESRDALVKAIEDWK